jgi:hypothetical protein
MDFLRIAALILAAVAHPGENPLDGLAELFISSGCFGCPAKASSGSHKSRL